MNYSPHTSLHRRRQRLWSRPFDDILGSTFPYEVNLGDWSGESLSKVIEEVCNGLTHEITDPRLNTAFQ